MNSSYPNKGKAVVLLSGGLDSSTIVAIAQRQGYDLYGLSFNYGQRQQIELEAAKELANYFGLKEHRIATIDLRLFGGSALTSDIPVPKARNEKEMAREIPVTYVPARNTIFLSYALAWAEILQAQHIFIGVNAVDYSGYPDCRPAFVDAFEYLANLANKYVDDASFTIKLHAPLLHLTKAEIIAEGTALGVPYEKTHSCYDPIGKQACGQCDACFLRHKGFIDAGVSDPTPYMALPRPQEKC